MNNENSRGGGTKGEKDEPKKRSPMITARKAPPIRVAASSQQFVSDGVVPAGTLLAVPVGGGMVGKITADFSNPREALALAMGCPPKPMAGQVADEPDYFLQQFRAVLARAGKTLALFRGERDALSEYAHAAQVLGDLDQWATTCQVLRSGGDASIPLEVGRGVVDKVIEFSKLGKRLAALWDCIRSTAGDPHHARVPEARSGEAVVPAKTGEKKCGDLEGMLSTRDLADAVGLSDGQHERLRKKLQRFRSTQDDGWVEVTDRRPRDPQYLYDPKLVAQIVESVTE